MSCFKKNYNRKKIKRKNNFYKSKIFFGLNFIFSPVIYGYYKVNPSTTSQEQIVKLKAEHPRGRLLPAWIPIYCLMLMQLPWFATYCV